MQNFLEQDYKIPTYAVFIIIALGTIVVGLTLGGVSAPKNAKRKWEYNGGATCPLYTNSGVSSKWVCSSRASSVCQFRDALYIGGGHSGYVISPVHSGGLFR